MLKIDDKRINSFVRAMCLLALLSVFAIAICLCAGRYKITIGELISILLLGQNKDSTAYNVLFHIRIPRICVSYVIGIGLACSGAVYQSLFQNRLVSPGVLGVDAGASVGAGVCILLGLNSIVTSICSFSFGLLAAFLAVSIQRMARSNSPSVLVLAGIIVSAFMNSMIGIIKYVADSQNKLASITFWMMGDLSGAEMEDLYTLLPVTLICIFIIYTLRWRLNAFSLGERIASSIGINYRVESTIVVICATFLTSISVSVAGTIGWVGLIIPNVARGLFGSDNMKMIPSCILLGGVFMVIVDTFARSLAPSEIPLGIITGFLGALTYMFILIRKGRYV